MFLKTDQLETNPLTKSAQHRQLTQAGERPPFESATCVSERSVSARLPTRRMSYTGLFSQTRMLLDVRTEISRLFINYHKYSYSKQGLSNNFQFVLVILL